MSGRLARVALAFLVLGTLHLGAVRAALGMSCVRASVLTMAPSTTSAIHVASGAESPVDAPHPLGVVAGCGTTAWPGAALPSLPSPLLVSRTVPSAEARSGPDAPRTPPFHPPRRV